MYCGLHAFTVPAAKITFLTLYELLSWPGQNMHDYVWQKCSFLDLQKKTLTRCYFFLFSYFFFIKYVNKIIFFSFMRLYLGMAMVMVITGYDRSWPWLISVAKASNWPVNRPRDRPFDRPLNRIINYFN